MRACMCVLKDTSCECVRGDMGVLECVSVCACVCVCVCVSAPHELECVLQTLVFAWQFHSKCVFSFSLQVRTIIYITCTSLTVLRSFAAVKCHRDISTQLRQVFPSLHARFFDPDAVILTCTPGNMKSQIHGNASSGSRGFLTLTPNSSKTNAEFI